MTSSGENILCGKAFRKENVRLCYISLIKHHSLISEVSLLPLSTILRWDFDIVQTVWYICIVFDIVQTVWYICIVFDIVQTVWYICIVFE
jgi:hypothetical protein